MPSAGRPRLDDFGAGAAAAAFQYLRALDVDFVKIDGVYVREALSVPNGKVYLASWRPCAGIWTSIRLPNSSKRRKWLVC